MQQTINPATQTVEACLKQRSYEIDFYQREYVWSKETVDTLLKDIFYTFELSYTEYKDEEICAEVLEKYNWYYLNIFITSNERGKVYVVDGQQRLTTLTLIATRLYHLTENENLKDVLKSCVYAKDMFKGNIFVLDNNKRKDVMNSLLKGEDYNGPFRNRTEETLVARYKDICRFIDDKAMDEKKLNTFTYYFLNRLILVQLGIDKDDTSMIFEVINDRGEALKPFEILKGKMIGLLPKGDDTATKYSEKWNNAMSILSGNEDNFFSDLIKSKYIFKRNSKLEADINNTYHRYIFDHNDISDSLQFRKTDLNHKQHIKDFIDKGVAYYSKLYASIIANPNEFLVYCNKINYLSGQYQNILSACKINDAKEQQKICVIAKEFDRLWMLLNLNGIYDSNQFQELSYILNEELKNADIELYRNIFNSLIIETIKNNRNVTEVSSLLDYNVFLRKNYSNMNTRSLRYYLARIEQYICEHTNQQMQNSTEYIATRTGNVTGYHIEHILSHNETNRAYFDSDEEFENQRNLLGGLLLLKGLDNISAGNEEYEDKLRTYSHGLQWGHSLAEDFYHANKDFQKFNNWLIDNYKVSFKSYTQFDKSALAERSRLLYTLTKIVWDVE
ncbi:MAG: DUF262 domain-containing protein [Prevotella sp.]|nr:DUF262 domain-containing protein [Prevotella sp.]